MRIPKPRLRTPKPPAPMPKTGLPRRKDMNPQQMANKLQDVKKQKRSARRKGYVVGGGVTFAATRGSRSPNKGRAPSKTNTF